MGECFFWYRPTLVVPDQRLLNGCVCVCVCVLLHLKVISHTHTHPFNGPLSRTTRVSQYQKGKTSLDFTEARDSEWQWHQQGRMQVCTSHQTDNHTGTSLLSFLQAGRPSCHPTNSVKALKAVLYLKVIYDNLM